MESAGFGSHSYEGLCNEPDMAAPYSYLYAGRPDRLCEVVHGVKTYSFAPGRGGLAGADRRAGARASRRAPARALGKGRRGAGGTRGGPPGTSSPVPPRRRMKRTRH